jgi:hypothetical protein
MTKPTPQPDWRQARRCTGGNCVQVARADRDRILIRDSKNPGATPLSFAYPEWLQFVEAVKQGEFAFE